jgi:DNA-binding Xre family transcriptional regulator
MTSKTEPITFGKLITQLKCQEEQLRAEIARTKAEMTRLNYTKTRSIQRKSRDIRRLERLMKMLADVSDRRKTAETAILARSQHQQGLAMVQTALAQKVEEK